MLAHLRSALIPQTIAECLAYGAELDRHGACPDGAYSIMDSVRSVSRSGVWKPCGLVGRDRTAR